MLNGRLASYGHHHQPEKRADGLGKPAPPPRQLLRQPFVEAFGQLLIMVGPEFGRDHEGGFRVFRCGRQIGEDFRRYLRDRSLERRTLGNILRLRRHHLRVHGESDELVGDRLFLRPLRLGPEVEVHTLAVPDDLERLAAVLDGVVDAAVLALQLRFPCGSESMGDHDSEVMDGGSID